MKLLKSLYDIFSKELLLVVLEDFLPTLESVINTYLGGIVEYEVLLHLPLTEAEKMELNIFVSDEKGKRPVKSLSGGQKSVLKLAWILSVASMMHSPFLFLDETMTSMDAETIQKVAEVLKWFVERKQTKLYVVTHSPAIQDMTIRDSVIEI